MDHRLSASDTLYGRFTSYDVSDLQPFGTSSLNETLVPGFGRTVTTKSRNLALGYTHAFGTKWLNEIRFGYLNASGGQVSPNQGTNFAAASGLQGVTTNPLDMGYPQVSFGGLFSTIGDPATFVSRDDRSYELYDNVMFDHGAHHVKFGGYLFRLEFNPVNPNNARGAFTYNGQWTGNAFADFLLGYPSSAQVGIGRADEHGRSTWLHVYGAGRLEGAVEPDGELRPALRNQQPDDRHRQSSVGDRPDGARRPLRHRQRRQRPDFSDRATLAVADPDSLRDLARTPGGPRACFVPATFASRPGWGWPGRWDRTGRRWSTPGSASS